MNNELRTENDRETSKLGLPEQEVIYNIALEGHTFHDEECLDSIINKTLKTQVKAYLKAETKGRKAAWEMVRLLASMSEHIKEDFGSDYKFAEFMECSQSTINKRKRLGNYAYELEEHGYTDTQAFELLPLITKVENIIVNNTETPTDADNMRTSIVNDISVEIPPTLTQKEIRTLVKEYTTFYNIDTQTVQIGLDVHTEEEVEDKTEEEVEDKTEEEVEEFEETPEYYLLPVINDDGKLEIVQLILDESDELELAELITEFISSRPISE